MNLRYWDKFHTYGLITGFFSVLLFLPAVCYYYTLSDNSSMLPFDYYSEMLFSNDVFTGKALSLAVVPNLIWFYISLNKKVYNFSMGIILASFSFIPYILFLQYL